MNCGSYFLKCVFCEHFCFWVIIEKHFILKQSSYTVGVVVSLLPWQPDIFQQSLLTD